MGEVISHDYEFIWNRRQAVLQLWRRGISAKKIALLLAEEYDSPTSRTIESDIKLLKQQIAKQAADLFGSQRQAVADYVSKTIDLRVKALIQGDYRLVANLDKDLLKLVGVNLDRIELAFDFGDQKTGEQMTVMERINQIREQKMLTQVTADEI